MARRLESALVGRYALAIIFLAYWALALGYAVGVPMWNAPDEPAHYNYVRFIAETGRLPVLEPGDYDQQRIQQLTSTRFPAGESVAALAYEDHQPPLYYLLGTPVYLLASGLSLDGRVLVLRAYSIALGSIALVLSALAARLAFPSVPILRWAVPAFFAGVPMNTFIMGSINNDALAEAVATGCLVALLLVFRRGFTTRRSVVCGLLLGAALLTKVSLYPLVPLALLWLWLARGVLERSSATLWRGFRSAFVAGVVAAAVSLWWFVRDLAVYGWPDLFGLLRHDQVVVGQPRTGAVTQATVDYFANTLFRSFWAQFGWMGILIDSRLYLVLRLLSLLATLGLLLLAARLLTHRQGIGASELLPLALILVWPALLLAGLIGYNLTFIQAQGRYLFPSLACIAMLFMLGLREVSLPFWKTVVPLGAVVLLLGINLISLVRFVIPYFV